MSSIPTPWRGLLLLALMMGLSGCSLVQPPDPAAMTCEDALSRYERFHDRFIDRMHQLQGKELELFAEKQGETIRAYHRRLEDCVYEEELDAEDVMGLISELQAAVLLEAMRENRRSGEDESGYESVEE